MEEWGVVAAVPDKELLFDAGVRDGEGTALWLEDGADTLVVCDHVETGKQVVVRQCSDALSSGETGTEAGVK